MPRNVSADALAALLAQQTQRAIVTLLTITHPDLSAPVYLSDFLQPGQMPFISNGQTYLFLPFQPILPLDSAAKSGEVKLTAPNINGSLLNQIRGLGVGYPQVGLMQVTDFEPDYIQASYDMILLSIVSDLVTITASLGWEDISVEPYPYQFVTPQTFNGIFR